MWQQIDSTNEQLTTVEDQMLAAMYQCPRTT